jgi:predicted Abi (CAAX) family protease
MTHTAFERWYELLKGAFALRFDAFKQVVALPNGLWFALVIVLLAGLSLAIAQSTILFISRVQPKRFTISILVSAVLFTLGSLFQVLSTWIVCLLPGTPDLPFLTLVKVIGLGYAPLLLSFLGALPYLGYPIEKLLAVWNLLAMVIGFAAIAQVEAGTAFLYIVLGWFVKEYLQGTIGQPIAQLGSRIADRAAGVTLAHTRQELNEQISAGVRPTTSIPPASQVPSPEVPQLSQTSGRSAPEAARTAARTSPQTPAATPLKVTQQIDSTAPLVRLKHQLRGFTPRLTLVLSLLVMAIGFAIVLILLRPVREGLFGWYTNLRGFWRPIADLSWIATVAIVFAGILAPLESLGWWAGWYGDELDTATAPTVSSDSRNERLRQRAVRPNVDRYIVYLDGIAQSGSRYTPDIEDFLGALEPALPPEMELVQGLMMYSMLNQPLDAENRPLALLWQLADKLRWANPASVLGWLVNLRNTIIVAVSSDKRYGPIYNQGIAQVIFDRLVERGYQPGSGIPIALIGYSGGAEMSVAAAPYLKRSTGAPIDVISIGGVMSANNNFLKLEQLYHIVGEKDSVERAGSSLFPGRWKIFPLSYWNRAKRKGKITVLSAGAVKHQVPGGYLDPKMTLPDGRTNLQQTIEMILQILRGEGLATVPPIPIQTSHYALYQAAAFNRPEYYPIAQPIDLQWYRPIGNWMGRLILPKPEARAQVRGAWFEIHYAPDEYRHLIGQTVKLRWLDEPTLQQAVRAATKDVHFSADAEFSSRYEGAIHPDRLDRWRQVDPLESLAGSHPVDDLIVMLDRQVAVREDILYIDSTPIQITGRFYALVRFVQPIAGTDRFQVGHFDRASRQFSGKTEEMRLPAVILAKSYGSYPSTTRDLEKSPLNETGWYVYGAKDAEGIFVVQSIAPRALCQLQPQAVKLDRESADTYIRQQAWADIVEHKGQVTSVLCANRANDATDTIQSAVNQWQVGDSPKERLRQRALVIHTYGGIGGKRKEPAAATPIFFGHFAYGVAEVVHEPLADEPRFEISYHQVYCQNTEGLIAGTLHWSRYMGDRQFGWLGTRPTCDILIKLDAFTGTYRMGSVEASPLEVMIRQLEVMTARYRIGDGTGSTFVGAANNCAQDSNRALFASIRTTARRIQENPQILQLLLEDADRSQRFRTLQALGQDLERLLEPFGSPRADWEKNEYNLGSTLEDHPLQNLWMGLGSWRTILPRKASDAIVQTFLKHGASVWVLRTNQVGGSDPEIEPIAPMTL